MCSWVTVNGVVCKTQDELSLEMGCCIYISGEPHGQPAGDGCLCTIDVPRMAAEVGMRCSKPCDIDSVAFDSDAWLQKDYDMIIWIVTSEPEDTKSFQQCFEEMKKLGPTGWDGLPDIQEAIDELR